MSPPSFKLKSCSAKPGLHHTVHREGRQQSFALGDIEHSVVLKTGEDPDTTMKGNMAKIFIDELTEADLLETDLHGDLRLKKAVSVHYEREGERILTLECCEVYRARYASEGEEQGSTS